MIIGASWMLGVGGVTRVFFTEIFPLDVRGKAMSLITVVQWIGYFLATVPFVFMLDRLGEVETFSLYGLLSFCAWLYCYRYAPETKGRSLESIEQEILAGTKGLQPLGGAMSDQPVKLAVKTPQ